MKKRSRIWLWSCILAVFILFLAGVNNDIFRYGVAFGNKIRDNINDATSAIGETFATYKNQSAQISELKNIKIQKEQNDIIIANLQSEVAKMRSLTQTNIKPLEVSATLVRAYSFVEMGQYLRVWLKVQNPTKIAESAVDSAPKLDSASARDSANNFSVDSAKSDSTPKIAESRQFFTPNTLNSAKNPTLDSAKNPTLDSAKKVSTPNPTKPPAKEKIYGLIKDGYTAGIALYKDGLLQGILNGDSKVSYGVFVGENKNIGILQTDISGNVVVKYIAAWQDIKEGDEIITSGLDGIFFEGIGVGRVKNVRDEFSYIVAEVDLYNQNDEIGYFWMVDLSN
ncbi:rod shape-determining protein MreC [Helicobacter sp. 23-1044]